MQFKRWGFRKNATRDEWRHFFSTNAASVRAPVDVAGGPIVTDIRKKSQGSKNRARRWALGTHAAPSTSQASGSMQLFSESHAASISIPISNEPTTPQASTQPAITTVVGVADAPEARQSPATNPYWLVPEPGEVICPRLLTSYELPASSSQGLLDATSALEYSLDPSFAPPRSISPLSALDSQHEEFGLEYLDWDGLLASSEMIGFSASNNMAFLGMFEDANIWQALPFIRLELDLRSHGIVLGSAIGGPILGGFASKVVAGILTTNTQYTVRRNPDLRHSLWKFGSMLPGESSALITDSQAFETNFARMLLFSMLNGFAGLNDVPLENVLKFLNRVVVNKLLLDILEHSPQHVMRTLADNIFRAAIEATDNKVVTLMLERKLVDVNETVCLYRSSKTTPIERAAALQSLKLIRSLIAEGADVNKFHVADYDRKARGALYRLIRAATSHWNGALNSGLGKQTMTPELVETLNMIITAGARVNIGHLHMAIPAGEGFPTPELVHFLSLRISPEEHFNFFRRCSGQPYERSDLERVATLSDGREAARIIHVMINLCNKAGCNDCLIKSDVAVEQAVIDAARLGHIELVMLLLGRAHMVSRLHEVLIAAIKSQSHALIDFILNKNGIKFDPPAVEGRCNNNDFVQRVYVPTTPIAEAVRNDNEDLIQRLEAEGALDHLTEGDRFESLVIAAAEVGNTAYMKTILARAATSKQAYRPDTTALYLAIIGDHRDVTQMLLEAGAKQGRVYTQPGADHPLGGALALRNEELVHGLIAAGVHDRLESTRVSTTVMKFAMEWGNTSIITDIIREFPHIAVATENLQRLCTTCIERDSTDFFKSFLDAAPAIDEGGLDKCLETAVGVGHVDMISYLLDMGANPYNADVLQAAIPDQPEIVRLLLQRERRRQIVPKCIGTQVLVSVMGDGTGNAEALDELLKTQAIDFVNSEHLNSYGPALTPLGLAIQGSWNCDTNMAAMIKFLQAGADPNGIAKMATQYGAAPLWTALMVAIESGREDAVKMLLDHGANIDARPRLRITRTPLQYAAEIGSADMVSLLLSCGADVNSPAATRGGATALQFAAISGNCNIAAELLRHGAQLADLPSKVDGRWPLEGAAEHGRLDMIRFLWEVRDRVFAAGVPCDGFSERQCLRAMNFAGIGLHIGCRDLISELSGISVNRLQTDDYGAPWIAY